jgi:SAM-dependent methyltransferase
MPSASAAIMRAASVSGRRNVPVQVCPCHKETTATPWRGWVDTLIRRSGVRGSLNHTPRVVGIRPAIAISGNDRASQRSGPVVFEALWLMGQANNVSATPPSQYADDRNLAARQRLWATSRREPNFDLFTWVLDLARIVPGEMQGVLDVGCGNGTYELKLAERGHQGALVAADLSMGMLSRVSNEAKVQADVQRLPFASNTFDVVLAPHMLYHVPDIKAAASECRRVLRRDGRLVAVTNGVSNLVELKTLIETAVGSGWTMDRPSDQHFNLEKRADQLSASFWSITRMDCPTGYLVVSDIDALTDYVASVADHYEEEAGRPWVEVVDRARDLASAWLASEGELRFSTSVGAFVCS